MIEPSDERLAAAGTELNPKLSPPAGADSGVDSAGLNSRTVAGGRRRWLRLGLDLLWPLLWLGLGSWLLVANDADRVLAAGFASLGGEAQGEPVASASAWAAGERQPWAFLYDFGPWPALALALAAVGLLLAMLFRPGLARWRKLCLYWLGCLALGPGLIVNALLKDHYGRPRPREVADFGGDWRFEPLLEPDWSSPGKSFPNGHASMGFLFVALYFALRRVRPGWARLSLAGALIYGVAIGWARLAQGGHFPTDTLWSGGLVWIVCALLAAWFGLDRSPWSPVKAGEKRRSPWQVLGLVMLALGVLFAGLLALPISSRREFLAEQATKRTTLHLAGRDAIHRLRLVKDGWGLVEESSGHGLPGSGIKARAETEATIGDKPSLFEYKERSSGLAWELVHRTEARVAEDSRRIRLQVADGAAELVLDLRDFAGAEPLEVELDGAVARLQVVVATTVQVDLNLPEDRREIRASMAPTADGVAREIELDFRAWQGKAEDLQIEVVPVVPAEKDGAIGAAPAVVE